MYTNIGQKAKNTFTYSKKNIRDPKKITSNLKVTSGGSHFRSFSDLKLNFFGISDVFFLHNGWTPGQKEFF
jgi:hypothetical protein